MYSVTKRIPLQNEKCTLRKRYKTYVCFVTLYVMWRSRFDTFMFSMLTLCAARLSNIHILWRLRCVHLHYLATPFMSQELWNCINLRLFVGMQRTISRASNISSSNLSPPGMSRIQTKESSITETHFFAIFNLTVALCDSSFNVIFFLRRCDLSTQMLCETSEFFRNFNSISKIRNNQNRNQMSLSKIYLSHQ